MFGFPRVVEIYSFALMNLRCTLLDAYLFSVGCRGSASLTFEVVSDLCRCPGGVEKSDPLLDTTTEIRSCILQSLCSRSGNADSQLISTRSYVEHPIAFYSGHLTHRAISRAAPGHSSRGVWLK